jgi:LDH2 family malate/lactate/ureidoglycolate dehydrogenase
MAVFNVAAFRDLATFKQEVTDFAQYLKDTPKAEGFTEVFYPGEVEYRKEQDRRKNGVPIEDATWKRLADLASGYGIAEKLGF